MQFSLISLVLVASAALSAAAPPPGPKGPTVGGVSQSCSASQSSIHCCNTEGNKVGHSKNVQYPDGSNQQLVCSQIDESNYNKQLQSICSTTVACCIGDGCTAIAN